MRCVTQPPGLCGRAKASWHRCPSCCRPSGVPVAGAGCSDAIKGERRRDIVPHPRPATSLALSPAPPLASVSLPIYARCRSSPADPHCQPQQCPRRGRSTAGCFMCPTGTRTHLWFPAGQRGPPVSAWPWLPRPGSGRGLVLCLDRKTNEFHYGIAILFHVSGSLRLTCSPGCDKPRHPRARARALGLCMLAGTELPETPPHLLQTQRAAGLRPSSLPLGTWGESVCPLATQGFRSGARWGAQHPTCTCLYARMPPEIRWGAGGREERGAQVV